jgi:hypothetical protein
MEMNERRSHGGILGKWGRESQTMLGCLVVTIHLSNHALIPLGYLLRRSSYGMRLQPNKIPVFIRRFSWMMLDGVSKEPRLSGRGFLNQEDFCSSATLRAAIPPRSSERGILADLRESAEFIGRAFSDMNIKEKILDRCL